MNAIENVIGFVTEENTETENKVKVEVVYDEYGIASLDDEMFDMENSFVITGNDRLKSYNTDNEWYESAKGIITDICCYYDMENPDDVQELAESYKTSTEVIMEINSIIDSDDFRDENTDDFVSILNALYPDISFNWMSIRGYSQGDWNEIIYKVDELTQENIEYVESIYFGKYALVYVTEDDDSCINGLITDSELWDIEDNYKSLCERFNVPIGSEIYIHDNLVKAV